MTFSSANWGATLSLLLVAAVLVATRTNSKAPKDFLRGTRNLQAIIPFNGGFNALPPGITRAPTGTSFSTDFPNGAGTTIKTNPGSIFTPASTSIVTTGPLPGGLPSSSIQTTDAGPFTPAKTSIVQNGPLEGGLPSSSIITTGTRPSQVSTTIASAFPGSTSSLTTTSGGGLPGFIENTGTRTSQSTTPGATVGNTAASGFTNVRTGPKQNFLTV